jgi:hypothetical protein
MQQQKCNSITLQHGSDPDVARRVLREVALDATAPAAARAQAARTLLELAGQLGRHAEDPADKRQSALDALSRADLVALIRERGS